MLFFRKTGGEASARAEVSLSGFSDEIYWCSFVYVNTLETDALIKIGANPAFDGVLTGACSMLQAHVMPISQP